MSKDKLPANSPAAIGPANRNKEIRRVRVADLIEAPWNDRLHPEAQKLALDEVVQQAGWYGYPDTWIMAAPPELAGRLCLCDGHLRKEWLIAKYGDAVEIDVNVTDFTEAEARLATATRDPIAAMARHNQEKQRALLESLTKNSRAAVQKILDGVQQKAIEPAKPSEPTKLKPLLPAPPQTWVLIGIDTMRYSEISEQVQQLANVPDILIETVSNGDG